METRRGAIVGWDLFGSQDLGVESTDVGGFKVHVAESSLKRTCHSSEAVVPNPVRRMLRLPQRVLLRMVPANIGQSRRRSGWSVLGADEDSVDAKTGVFFQ